VVTIRVDVVVLEALYCSLLHKTDVCICHHILPCLLTSCSDGLWHMKIRIRIAYVLIGVTYVVVMAIILGACRPFNHHWQINPNPGGISPYYCPSASRALTSSPSRPMHASNLKVDVFNCRYPQRTYRSLPPTHSNSGSSNLVTSQIQMCEAD
jgi:hypothetical protein